MIRKASKKDLKEVGKLLVEEFSKPPFNEKTDLKTVNKCLDFHFKNCNVFVDFENDELVGAVIFKVEQWWSGAFVLIEDLAVRKDFRNKGLGKKLVKCAEDYAREKKAYAIGFNTIREAKAVGFYERLGYRRSNKMIFMSKRLQ